VTEDEYYLWFERAGFRRTGEETILTEEMKNEADTTILVTKASELSPDERAKAIGRFKMYLGIDYPPHGRGVH